MSQFGLNLSVESVWWRNRTERHVSLMYVSGLGDEDACRMSAGATTVAADVGLQIPVAGGNERGV